jgi:hypothetical protein
VRKWIALGLLALAGAVEAQPLTGGLLGRGASYSSFVAPSGCTTGSMATFLGSLTCVPGLTYAGGVLSVPGAVSARNFTTTALATPTVTSVTPTLTQVGTINVVAGASLADGDYFTVDYGSGTIPIEFEATPPNGTTGGRIPFTFAAGDAAGTIRDGLIALINLAAPTKVVASIGGAAAITVSMVTPGEAGGVITENVANAGFTVAGFANPTAATTYGYEVVSYLADGTSTAASAEVTTAAGHATLSASNYNTVVFAPSPGSTSTRLYRTTGGTAPPKLLYTGTATSYVDVGDAGTAQTPATANTTGTLTGRFRDGSAAAPGIPFASSPTQGWYRSSFGRMAYSHSGNSALALGDEIYVSSGRSIAWSSGSDPGTQTPDTLIGRAAAATLQLGAANAASPVAQRLKVQDATGTNTASAAQFYVDGPNGTGNAAVGALVLRSGAVQASGSTAHVPTARMSLKEGHINIPGLPTYANNAAALVGGLVAGDLYTITGSDPLALAVTY